MPKEYLSGEGAAIDWIIEVLRLVNGDQVKLDVVYIYKLDGADDEWIGGGKE